MGEAPDSIVLVETPEDVEALELEEGQSLAYLTQTTLSLDDTADVVDALRERVPDLVGPPSADICYATQNRQDAVKRICDEATLVLVVGSKTSSNANRLVEVAHSRGADAYLIDDETDLDPAWLEGHETVGLTAGASSPEVIVERVVARLGRARLPRAGGRRDRARGRLLPPPRRPPLTSQDDGERRLSGARRRAQRGRLRPASSRAGPSSSRCRASPPSSRRPPRARSPSASCRSRARSRARSTRRTTCSTSRRSRSPARRSSPIRHCLVGPGARCRSRRSRSSARTRRRSTSAGASSPRCRGRPRSPRRRPPTRRTRSPRTATPSEAAIASERAASMYGLTVIAGDVGDHPEAYTRFVSVAPYTRLDRESDGWRTAFSFVTDHAPGRAPPGDRAVRSPPARHGPARLAPDPADAVALPLRRGAGGAPARRGRQRDARRGRAA